MTWQKSRVTTPISDAIADALKPIQSFLSAADPVLEATSTALGVAKVFVSSTEDLLQKLIGLLSDELENLVNDLFGTGFYVLTISPYDQQSYIRAHNFIKSYDPKKPLGSQYKVTYSTTNRTYVDNKLVETEVQSEQFFVSDLSADEFISSLKIESYDDLGVPILYTYQALSMAIQSFDDLGDDQRPMFSDDASVAAIGIMATSPALGDFLNLMTALMNVFKPPKWGLEFGKFTEFTTQQYESIKPDWRSFNLKSFPPMDNIYKSLLDMVYHLRGYQTVADTNLEDLITIIQDKIDVTRAILNKINTLIKDIKSSTGLYVMDVPLGSGGNTRLKQAISDPSLQNICALYRNKYSFLTIIVGGGPSLQTVEALRKLLTV